LCIHKRHQKGSICAIFCPGRMLIPLKYDTIPNLVNKIPVLGVLPCRAYYLRSASSVAHHSRVESWLNNRALDVPIKPRQSLALPPVLQRFRSFSFLFHNTSHSVLLPYRSTTIMFSPVKIAFFTFLSFAVLALAIPTAEGPPQDPKALISSACIDLERIMLPLSSCCFPFYALRVIHAHWPLYSLYYLCQCDI
jgi:hypothetical protein